MTISADAFALWCRQARERCVLVEVDYMHQVGIGDAAVPTKGTIYTSNLGYVDESASPVQTYDEALLAVPVFERALDTSTLRGAVTVNLSGPFVFNNADGRYDFLLYLALDGSESRVYVGDPSWARADFVHLFTVLNAKAAASKQQQIELTPADIGLLLNKSIGGTVAVGGTGPNANAFRPLPFGYVHQMAPVLIQTSPSFKYAFSDRGTNCSAQVVRANGAALTVTTDYTDGGDGTLTLVGNPQGNQITADVLLYPPGKTSVDYRIQDAIEFFVGGEAGLTALGKFGALRPSVLANLDTIPHCQTLLTEKTNLIAWLDEAMSTTNFFWSQYRSGEFYYDIMRPEALPAVVAGSGGASPIAAEIGFDDVLAGSLSLDHRLPSYASYQCVANINQEKQTSFAGTLTADQRAMLERDGYVSAHFIGEEVTTAYLGATATWLGGAPELYDLTLSDSQIINTLISGPNDTAAPDPAFPSQTPSAYMATLNSIRRSVFLPWTEFVDFATFLEFYALEIGDIINLIYPRFDLDGGELHQVYRISIDAMKARIELGVTRRRFAVVTGAVPPFDFLLMETGDLVLLESGDDIIISTSGGTSVFNLLLDGGGTLLQLNGSHLQIH